MGMQPKHLTARDVPALASIDKLIAPMLRPGEAAVVVTHYATPLHVIIVRASDAETTSRIAIEFLDEQGFGPEYDVLIGTRPTN